MATLAELTRLGTGLSAQQLMHLQRLIAWWGMLADLSFSDFAERRDPGELERTYLETFHQLARMIASGVFPFLGHDVDMDEIPRVGDGLLVVDPEARIQYASPNALSTLHRVGVLGNVAGRRLRDLGMEQPVIAQAIGTSGPVTAEVERNDTAVQLLADRRVF